MAPTHRANSISLNITDFEDAMEWESYDITDFWMDHELVDHEPTCMALYHCSVAEHRIYEDCAKFRIGELT